MCPCASLVKPGDEDSMKNISITITIFVALISFLSGCTQKGASSPLLPAATEIAAKPSGQKAVWETEWERTLAVAKKVVVVLSATFALMLKAPRPLATP